MQARNGECSCPPKTIVLDLGVGADGRLGAPTRGLLQTVEQSCLKGAGCRQGPSSRPLGGRPAGRAGRCLQAHSFFTSVFSFLTGSGEGRGRWKVSTWGQSQTSGAGQQEETFSDGILFRCPSWPRGWVPTLSFSSPYRTAFSACIPGPSATAALGLVSSAGFQAPYQTCGIRNRGQGPESVLERVLGVTVMPTAA